jgi:hypothetical protein
MLILEKLSSKFAVFWFTLEKLFGEREEIKSVCKQQFIEDVVRLIDIYPRAFLLTSIHTACRLLQD